jgi:FkbM family methyltransferase
MLSNPAKGIVRKIVFKLTKEVYDFIAKTKDPLVDFQYGAFIFKVPFSHNLPFILKTYPQYSSNLGRIAKYIQAKYTDLTLIDVGANIGDSVFVLRGESEFPILCIEGDDYYFEILQSNVAQFPTVFLEKAYLGQENQETNKEILRQNGTAHLVVSTKSVPIMTLPNLLKKHPNFSLSKILKIDTDGFDGFIIRGATDFLNLAKPVIFFEYDPYFMSQQNDDGLSIFKSLRESGYQALIIYDNFGDYMLSLRLDQVRLLDEIHCYFLGRDGMFYADICAFHFEDLDLFETVRSLEMDFSKNRKLSN